MGGYKIRQASCKFHHIMRLFFDNTLNFHLSQDNNCKNIWEACCRLYCEMGLENHDFSRRKEQSHGRRGNLNSTLRISCQDVALLKGFGIKNKLKPRIRSVCYWLKYCIVGEKCKNNLSGRNKLPPWIFQGNPMPGIKKYAKVFTLRPFWINSFWFKFARKRQSLHFERR